MSINTLQNIVINPKRAQFSEQANVPKHGNAEKVAIRRRIEDINDKKRLQAMIEDDYTI